MKKTHRTMIAAQASSIIDSPVGPLYLAATDGGLTHVLFVRETSRRPIVVNGSGKARRILLETERQLFDYFAGRLSEFDLELAPDGTDFQRAVWEALRQVPFGETVSYGELARRLDRPRSVRAVGSANGANPISIIVPCHRVIGANGTLVGYGGGKENKRRLLRLEGVEVAG